MEEHQLLTRISQYCASRERCHKEVRSKLIQLGIRGEELDQLISRLVEAGFLNEERYARAFVRGKCRLNQWGKVKIAAFLKMQGLRPMLIAQALEEIEDEEYEAILLRVMQKKSEGLQSMDAVMRQQKLFQYASQKGFESDWILRILENNF